MTGTTKTPPPVKVAIACTANTQDVLIDAEDTPALNHRCFRIQSGRVQIKAPAWTRWKDLAEYITGAVCAFRDDNPRNLTRENLVPCQRAWQKYH